MDRCSSDDSLRLHACDRETSFLQYVMLILIMFVMVYSLIDILDYHILTIPVAKFSYWDGVLIESNNGSFAIVLTEGFHIVLLFACGPWLQAAKRLIGFMAIYSMFFFIIIIYNSWPVFRLWLGWKLSIGSG